ncbi:hypothetical protein [Flavobacterium aquiphilum]|uniref:hypothetical protein n=1 Tax=Flavobacterium aquiphilum TaxID=3003261 RepID=UPI0024816531|nr:hypothetical protein [Flavobacterium aquiphilum]
MFLGASAIFFGLNCGKIFLNFGNMTLKQKLYFFLILITVYLIIILPVTYTSILVFGWADIPIVIIYGIINTLFAVKNFKGRLFLSIILGFFISSSSLCFVYLPWYLGFYRNVGFGVLIYFISSILIWIVLIQNSRIIVRIKNLYLIVFIPTLFFLIVSFFLKEIYPTQFENENLTQIQITVLDKYKIPEPESSIEIRIDRQPLFSLKGSHKILETITDRKGSIKVKLSKSNNYKLYINTKKGELIFFDIDSTDLKKKNLFFVETKNAIKT